LASPPKRCGRGTFVDLGLALTAIPLRLGPLTPPGFLVVRSVIRWLREDGATVRPGEAVAFCNVGLAALSTRGAGVIGFDDEWLDVQAVMAPRVGGTLRRAQSVWRGGFHEQLEHFRQPWTPEFEIGSIVPDGGPALPGSSDEVELYLTAARRQADLAEGRHGLLTGWHDRVRAWRAEGDGPLGSVISLGICEMTGVLRGEHLGFLELFEQIAGPAHVIQVADEPLVHSAPIIAELGARTEAERELISADLIDYFARARARPVEWVFAGVLLKALHRSPLTESYDVLGRGGVRRVGPADAVVLSAGAEGGLLRHRRLGYALNVHDFRAVRAGPIVSAWLREAFEPVRRSIDDVGQDYRALFRAIRATPGGRPKHILIANLMSTSGDDDIQNYQAFDAPMAETLSGVRARDMNLMLHDLAREDGDVAIVDVDAIAAEMGARRNLPDGLHSSGALQVELRAEIMHILCARGMPGFGPARLG
jgi:hypothetical protein